MTTVPFTGPDLGRNHRYGYGASATRQRRDVLGEQRREDLLQRLPVEYAAGANIQTLAVRHGLRYWAAHKLLVEAGVELRPRGRRPASSLPARDDVSDEVYAGADEALAAAFEASGFQSSGGGTDG